MGKADKAAKSSRRGGFLIGTLAGAVLGLLFAPRPGRETREMLFGEGGLDFAAQKDRLKSALGAGRESAADQSDALRRKIEETRARLRDEMAQE